MKIAFTPNICNNNYICLKAIRKFSNIDAHLYISNTADIQNLPESEDIELKDNYPNWIHKHKHWDVGNFIRKRSKTFINELNKYDIVFLSDTAVMLAPYLKGIKVFIVTGADLTKMPFAKKFPQASDSILDVIKRRYLSFLQRKGIQSIDYFWSQSFDPFLNSLAELKISKSKINETAFKVFIDTNVNKFDENFQENIDKSILAQIQKFDFVIFHPSRIMMKVKGGHTQESQLKNNERLFYAFKLFLEKNNFPNVGLILIDRSHGGQIEEAKKIIKDCGIKKNVEWIKAKSIEGFAKHELINLYSACDMVADEFGIGWFGSIVCEGLACGKPVICYVDEVAMGKMYSWHPIISTNTIDGIADEIYKLYSNKIYAQEVGQKGLKWINEFHTLETAGRNITKEIKNIFKNN
jgi:glycosyltransferase involved in cell wall biosynthesis